MDDSGAQQVSTTYGLDVILASSNTARRALRDGTGIGLEGAVHSVRCRRERWADNA